MNTKYINVALVILSVALLVVVCFGYFGLKKASEKAKLKSSSDTQEPEESAAIDPSLTVDSTLAQPPKLDDTSDPNESAKDDASTNISANVLAEWKSFLSNKGSNLTSSRDQKESPRSLYEENEESEASSDDQNISENEIQAERNAQSEVLNENFMPSEEENTELGVQSENAHESTVTLEQEEFTQPMVPYPFDEDMSFSIQIIEEAGRLFMKFRVVRENPRAAMRRSLPE